MLAWPAIRPERPWNWRYIANLGLDITKISVALGWVYGVRCDHEVVCQKIQGATPHGWRLLCPGPVRNICIASGPVRLMGLQLPYIYAIGCGGRHGLPLQRFTRSPDGRSFFWQNVSNGQS